MSDSKWSTPGELESLCREDAVASADVNNRQLRCYATTIPVLSPCGSYSPLNSAHELHRAVSEDPLRSSINLAWLKEWLKEWLKLGGCTVQQLPIPVYHQSLGRFTPHCRRAGSVDACQLAEDS